MMRPDPFTDDDPEDGDPLGCPRGMWVALLIEVWLGGLIGVVAALWLLGVEMGIR